ncbi:MAG: tripartite tricarboxylate transporter TctB family protein [Peptoniphilus sp.]|nr:tripartite tricarboxylate transporter TctB family protein [Peptoniphilus sp.]
MESKENRTENSKKQFNYNFISVILLYAWAILFIFETRKISDMDSKFFPYIVSGIAILLATILLFSSIFGPRKDETFDFSGTSRSIKFGILLLVYVILISFFGFYISTPIYLLGAMYVLGQRNKKIMLGVAIFTPLVVYLFFEVLLKLNIPDGIII